MYDFIPTDEEWNAHKGSRVVERIVEYSGKSCVIRENDTAVFYQVAFNLSGNKILSNETEVPNAEDGLFEIDYRSLLCLSPERVANPRPIMKVVSCSHLGSTSCANSSLLKRTLKMGQQTLASYKFDITAGSGKIGYGFLVMNSDDVKLGFPEYENPTLYCLQQCVGLYSRCCRRRGETNCRKIWTPCLMVSQSATHTLFERWIITNEFENNVSMIRHYPGPVVEGIFNFGRNRAVVALLDIRTSMAWWEFAGAILTESLVYRYRPTMYVMKRGSTRTFIPTYSIILGAAILLVVFTGCVLYWFTLRHDRRPRFNTVGGLSSILRKEVFQCGNSLQKGGAVVVSECAEEDDVLRIRFQLRSKQ